MKENKYYDKMIEGFDEDEEGVEKIKSYEVPMWNIILNLFIVIICLIIISSVINIKIKIY
jgi:hypothetical protein